MKLLERKQKTQPAEGLPIPPDIKDRVERAKKEMRKDAGLRRLCVKFWEGNHYYYLNARNQLRQLPTAIIDTTGQKPDHRIRKVYNFTQNVIEAKVSAASQQVPSYEVDPASSDPDDKAGARLAEQVAVYGFDKWRLRRMTIKTITNALVQREGFAMPYFDPDVGPYVQLPDGSYQGLGEIKTLSLTRSEVGWEPGVDFEDSRFHIIVRARLPEDIEKIPGFVGGSLKKDASTSDTPAGKTSDQMVEVTEYLERPCPDYPEGRRCFIANSQIVVDWRKADEDATDWWEPYPSKGPDGQPIDEPCIHRLSYTVHPEGDDQGLVERLIDLNRTINDCYNKLLEWKNRVLMPQMIAPRGSNVTRRDDTPGATYYYSGSQAPQWEPKPPVPREIFEILELAKADLRALAADIDVQPDPRLTTGTAQVAIEQNRARWQSFLGDLAEFHSRFMRHCLSLVALHYTEQRIIDIRGQYGSEPPISLTGADLRAQVNVRVFPRSIEAKTRQQAMQEIQFMQQNFPGALSPEVVMSVLHGGSTESLFKSYDLHIARAWSLVQQIRQDLPSVMGMPPRLDPEFGEVPGWMPRKQDNLVIWKQVIGDYMITPDFDKQPEEARHMFDLIWGGLEWLEQARMMKLAAQSQDAAALQGQQNAAKPQGEIPLPQLTGLSPQAAAPAAGTPE